VPPARRLLVYEYANADRASQYYGELRWTTASSVLQQKFGR
jgi:hypothetical protein